MLNFQKNDQKKCCPYFSFFLSSLCVCMCSSSFIFTGNVVAAVSLALTGKHIHTLQSSNFPQHTTWLSCKD